MERQHVMIIAEAGVNHNGKLELAKEMARVAKECGADAVKYQTTIAEKMISVYAPKAEYQKETTGDGENQLEMVRRLHFDFDAHRELKAYCDEIGIQYLSSPFDIDSVEFLATLDLPLMKIPSGEITNYPYLVAVAKTGLPIILSTGMSVPEEIEAAMQLLKENGSGEITLLHCNTEYPTEYKDANLGAMVWLRDHFHCPVGLSDHTRGIACPAAAVALGACCIEKHFTLDKTMEGPDHLASLEPSELREMVQAVRAVEEALGSGLKQVSPSEARNKPIARKSIVATRFIKKGEVLSEENLTTKRPGTGVDPMRWPEVLGTTAIRDFEEDELIEV